MRKVTSFQLPSPLLHQLHAAAANNPYGMTASQIIRRGIELALAEIAKDMRKQKLRKARS